MIRNILITPIFIVTKKISVIILFVIIIMYRQRVCRYRKQNLKKYWKNNVSVFSVDFLLRIKSRYTYLDSHNFHLSWRLDDNCVIHLEKIKIRWFYEERVSTYIYLTKFYYCTMLDSLSSKSLHANQHVFLVFVKNFEMYLIRRNYLVTIIKKCHELSFFFVGKDWFKNALDFT